jgi:hypothetical protein
MIGETTRLVRIAGLCALVAFATAANAATVTGLTNAMLLDMLVKGEASTVFPVIYEDNDVSQVVDDTSSTTPIQGIDTGDGNTLGIIDYVGDRIQGAAWLQQLSKGTPTDTTTILSPLNGTQLVTPGTKWDDLGGASGNDEMTAVFDMVATGSVVAYGETMVTYGAPASWTWTSDVVPAGTAVVIYDDPTPDISLAGAGWTGVIATDMVGAAGGDAAVWGTAGFGSGSEFYLTNALVTRFLFGLNWLSGPPATVLPGPIPDSLGNTLIGTGSLSASAPGAWDTSSDGDFKVLYAPLPPALWAGLALLGGLAGIRRIRRGRA